jgi:hypothetical protein
LVSGTITTIPALALMLVLTGCSSNSGTDNTEVLFIKHHLQECVGVAPRTCMLTRPSANADWTFMYSGIQGFGYEWGFDYEVRVRWQGIENPPADASSRVYELMSINSKMPVPPGTLFDFTLRFGSGVEPVSDGLYRLYGGREFSCAQADCQLLEELQAQGMAVLLELAHDAAGPLQLTQIKCADSPDSFSTSCL